MIDRQKAEKEKTLEVIEASRTTVNNFYAADYTYPISLAQSTVDILKHGLLPWAMSGIRKTIIIRVPGITQDQITHEMSHFALRELTANRPLPLWFDEGLACFVSGMDFGGDRLKLKKTSEITGLPNIIAWQGLTGKFRWLDQMYRRRNTALIYGQSFHLIGYLLEEFNKPLLLNFIRSLGQADFAESFSRSFGISQNSFYENFIKNLWKL